MHLDSWLLVANGAPRVNVRFCCGHTASPSSGISRTKPWWPASHISAAIHPWTFLIKLCQGSLIILDQWTLSGVSVSIALVIWWQDASYATLPCGNHDRTKLRDPCGLLEGLQSAEEVQRSRQVLAQISLAEIVFLCCFLLPILAIEVEFLVSQQCLTSFTAIRPMWGILTMSSIPTMLRRKATMWKETPPPHTSRLRNLSLRRWSGRENSSRRKDSFAECAEEKNGLMRKWESKPRALIAFTKRTRGPLQFGTSFSSGGPWLAMLGHSQLAFLVLNSACLWINLLLLSWLEPFLVHCALHIRELLVPR